MRLKFNRFFAFLLMLVLTLSLIGPLDVKAGATIKLNATSKTLYIGKTFKLKLSGTSEAVTFKSSNKNIASVSKKGTITAKKSGKATITATAGGKSYTCKVTVRKCSIFSYLNWPDMYNYEQQYGHGDGLGGKITDLNEYYVYLGCYYVPILLSYKGPSLDFEVADPAICYANIGEFEKDFATLYVYPLECGSTTITVTDPKVPSVSLTLTINVLPSLYVEDSITEITLKKGESKTIKFYQYFMWNLYWSSAERNDVFDASWADDWNYDENSIELTIKGTKKGSDELIVFIGDNEIVGERIKINVK